MKKLTRLTLKTETIRALLTAEMRAVAGALPTAALSAENVGCCSFDICPPPPTDGCPSRTLSCRAC